MSKIKFIHEYDFLLKHIIEVEYLKFLNRQYSNLLPYQPLELKELDEVITSDKIFEEAYFIDDLKKGNIIIDMNQNLNSEKTLNFIDKRIKFKIESVEYELVNPNDEEGNYVIKNPTDDKVKSISTKVLNEDYISVYIYD